MIFERPRQLPYKKADVNFLPLTTLQQFILIEYQKDLLEYIAKIENEIRKKEAKEKWLKNIFVLMRDYLTNPKKLYLNKNTNQLFCFKIQEILDNMEKEYIHE